MASEFQEISLPDRPINSLISSASITPQSFQIDFLFSLQNHHSDRLSPPPPSISPVDDDDDDDDDGFRTPISSDHKIPVVQHCPPAPTRPKPISLSRNRSSSMRTNSSVRRGFRVYVSDEIVDSIFCSDLVCDQKRKKARKEDENGGE